MDGDPSSLRSKSSDLFASEIGPNNTSSNSIMIQKREEICDENDQDKSYIKHRLASEDNRPGYL